MNADVKEIPSVLFIKESDPAVVLADGFYAPERYFTWSQRRSAIVVRRPTRIYLCCGSLRPGETRKILVRSPSQTQTVVFNYAYGYRPIDLGGNGIELVNFEADGDAVPSGGGPNADTRRLAFQLWTSVPNGAYGIDDTPTPVGFGTVARQIYSVFESKKEEDTLRPLHKELCARGCSASFLSDRKVVSELSAGRLRSAIFLISGAITYARLWNAGARGHFLYAEHGVSPLKKYTYDAHYLRYDLLLMPGRLWTDRLAQIYPELGPRMRVVGYPKLAGGAGRSVADRKAFCEQLNLNPAGPIVLFAPSWSGGDVNCGIFNLRHFSKSDSLLTIPHDGDVPFVPQFTERGYHVHVTQPGESISDYYPYADLLVSDVSSTAVEFAALGKHVLCLKTERIPDFDPRFRETDGRLRIPNTDAFWDFCPVVEPGNIDEAISGVLTSPTAPSEAARKTIADMISCFGHDATSKAIAHVVEYLRTVSPEHTREELA